METFLDVKVPWIKKEEMTYKKRKVRRHVLGRVYEEGHSWQRSCTCKERKRSPHIEQAE